MSTVTIDQALQDPKLLGAALGDPATWQTWLATLKATFGIELNREERRAFESIAGSRKPPEKKIQELWAVAGRGSGKSRMSAAVAVYIACFFEHDLDPGEVGYVLCLAGSRDQAQLVFSYAQAFLRKSPVLCKMIKSVTTHEIRLVNNVVIAIHTNSFRLIRGKTLLAVVADEIGHWRDELSANPDLEVYRAVRPSLARAGTGDIVLIRPAEKFQPGTEIERGGKVLTVARDLGDSVEFEVPEHSTPLRSGGALRIAAGNTTTIYKADLTLENMR